MGRIPVTDKLLNLAKDNKNNGLEVKTNQFCMEHAHIYLLVIYLEK